MPAHAPSLAALAGEGQRALAHRRVALLDRAGNRARSARVDRATPSRRRSRRRGFAREI
jgi:hypothetical protein